MSILKTNSKKNTLLDPNHTHFILVDNAKLDDFGGEIEFRAELESFIASGEYKKITMKNKSKPVATDEDLNARQSTPIILVVLGGGANTVTTVLKSLKKDIPCIFIDVSLSRHSRMSRHVSSISTLYRVAERALTSFVT